MGTIVEVLKMESEREICSARSGEEIRRNPQLVGYIDHGGAEHIENEAGEDSGGIGGVGNKVGDGVKNILFLGLDCGFD